MFNQNIDKTMSVFVEDAFKARDMGQAKIPANRVAELALKHRLEPGEGAAFAYLANNTVSDELFELELDASGKRGLLDD